MKIPVDGIVFWPGTNATIPGGWSEVAAFADRYFEGSAAAGTNGGSTSHSHTMEDHTHNGVAHDHEIDAGTSSGSTDVEYWAMSSTQVAADPHQHPAVDTPSYVIEYLSASTAIGNVTAHPPYYEVIAITPTFSEQDVPLDAIVFTHKTNAPGDFEICDGNSGTPNLQGRFLKATSSGGDGGGTGGSTSHAHSAIAGHSHVPITHAHGDTTLANASDGTLIMTYGPLEFVCPLGHHVAINLSNESAGITTSSGANAESVESEPPFYTLVPVQNKGAADTPYNLIVGYRGSGALPGGWVECDGLNDTPDLQGVQVKSDVAVPGTTGGDLDSHTHESNHGHEHSAGHDHTYTLTITADEEYILGATAVASATHEHLGTGTTSSEVPTLQNADVTVNFTDGRQLYRTIRWMTNPPPATVHVKGNVWIKGARAA